MSDLSERMWARLEAWESDGAPRRIWDHDPTIWATPDTPEITNRLGWLDLPSRMAAKVGEWGSLASEVADRGTTDVVLLGMGGSSLAPEVFSSIVPGDGPRLTVLDTTHPDAIVAVSERLDPATTVFVVSSKSGGTLETLSLFRFFWQWRSEAEGPPGESFIAVTDPGSGLAAMAEERGFLATCFADPDVGGRFSALTDFGMVPCALTGGDPAALLAMAARMEAACGPDVAATAHVGLDLGAWIGEATLAGRDKLTIVTSDSLRAFPAWWEQLLAESTGKQDTGTVPVPEASLGDPDSYGDDRLFLVYQLEEDPAVAGVEALEEAGFPIRVIHLLQREEIASEMYRAEFAVAAVGAVLGINPFDQPDVESAKASARELMEGDAEQASLQFTDVADLRARPGDYLALMAYLPMDEHAVARLERAAEALGEAHGVPVTIGFGPRFLHSTGQLHKGGPASCVGIQVMDTPDVHLPIPETDLDFGTVIRAQADGDAAVLIERGRRLARVALDDLPGE